MYISPLNCPLTWMKAEAMMVALSGNSTVCERPLGCGWEQPSVADVALRRFLPACSLGGVFSSAGARSRLTAVAGADYGTHPYTHKPGVRTEPYPACASKQGQPVWELFAEVIRPLISESRMKRNNVPGRGEPGAGLCYG